MGVASIGATTAGGGDIGGVLAQPTIKAAANQAVRRVNRNFLETEVLVMVSALSRVPFDACLGPNKPLPTMCPFAIRSKRTRTGTLMKTTPSIVIVCFLILAAGTIMGGQLGLFSGNTPTLGVRDGRLKPPSATPNSVSSQANLYPDHPQREYAAVAPLQFQGDGAVAMKKLADVLQKMERTIVVSQGPDYIYAQSTTALLKFTDDVEFWLDAPNKVIQVRSASRLGSKDLGVNRARVEAIRAAFAATNNSH